MMSSTTPNANSATATPLRPRPDQDQRWLAHKKPLTFTKAAALVLEAHQRDGGRQDASAFDLRTWAFGSDDHQTMQIAQVPLAGRSSHRPLALRELAFSQLCQRVGTPAAYIRELPMKLQIACMNWALVKEVQRAQLRLAGEEVRAVLSERYVPIDDSFLLDVVEDILGRAGYRESALVRATVTGLHTVLRITVPSEGVAVRAGDTIEWGLDIGNSELGLRSVQVTPVTFRLICSNGMRAWNSDAALRMRHVGDPVRLREQLRDAIPVALAEAKGDIARWKRATEVLVDNALEEIEALRALGLGTGDVQAVGRSLAASTGLTLPPGGPDGLNDALRMRTSAFDIANAITATAREKADIAARLVLEEAGHRYLVRSTA